MNLPTDLAGRVTLRIGGAEPAIRSSRPFLAERLSLGRHPAELPALMGTVFSLCGHAHRLASLWAVRAAQAPDKLPSTVFHPDASERLRLQHATARDQMMRMAHDWPRWLPGNRGVPHADFTGTLAHCPLWQRGEDTDDALQNQLDALPAWLAAHWLGTSPMRWLDQVARDPTDGVARWAHTASGPLAALLHIEHRPCSLLRTAHRPWQPLASPAAEFGALARWLQVHPEADALPQGPQGVGPHDIPDTGPWSRHHSPSALDTESAPTAWSRLTHRLIDLATLASPQGRHWLCAGALQPAPHQGMAWVEMARGLLIHWVRLEGDGPSARVTAARVIAPTDLNFHPQGVLAEALHTLRHPDDARRLAVAFDPCVEFSIEEPAHA